jgi:hypothetical protein
VQTIAEHSMVIGQENSNAHLGTSKTTRVPA